MHKVACAKDHTVYVKERVLWACGVSSPDLISIENVLGYIICCANDSFDVKMVFASKPIMKYYNVQICILATAVFEMHI